MRGVPPRTASAAVVMVLLAAGMLALHMRGKAPDAGLVELSDRAPARLGAVFDAAGEAIPIESFRGRTVILNLWAPWCAPCLAEMPSLDRLAARLPAKDFVILPVAKDPVGSTPSSRTFATMGLKRLQLYLDPDGRIAPEVGARGYPTTLVVGADGAPLAYREGAADWDSDAMAGALERLAERGQKGTIAARTALRP